MRLALQLFKNSINTQEKLRLNLHSSSVSVSELLEYGRMSWPSFVVLKPTCKYPNFWQNCGISSRRNADEFVANVNALGYEEKVITVQ